jgi:hypothetical protein
VTLTPWERKILASIENEISEKDPRLATRLNNMPVGLGAGCAGARVSRRPADRCTHRARWAQPDHQRAECDGDRRMHGCADRAVAVERCKGRADPGSVQEKREEPQPKAAPMGWPVRTLSSAHDGATRCGAPIEGLTEGAG